MFFNRLDFVFEQRRINYGFLLPRKKKLNVKSLHAHIISLIFYTFNIFTCLHSGSLENTQPATSTDTKEGLLICANFSATIFKSALNPVPARNRKNNDRCFLSKEMAYKRRKKERDK